MRILTTFVAVCLAGAFANAQDLNGRTITLKAGSQATVEAPLTLPFDGAAPDTQVVVEQKGTGKTFPVTIRNNEFVFVPEGASPGSELTYEVKVKDAKQPERVQIVPGDEPDSLKVLIEDQHFTSYFHANTNRKPYLWPVFSEGVTVTRDWPMGKEELSKDHKHHKSMWSSYGNVNGADCWAEGDNAGWQQTNEVTHGSGDAYGWIHAKNTWQDVNHKNVLDEEREYRFYASSPRGRLFDVSVTFTATYGDVLFKDTKEGGIFSLRIRDSINEENGGVMTLSEGRTGEKICWGKPSPWCDYSGMIPNDAVRGVTVMDTPGNLRYPTTWHVRAYGLLGANPFGLASFTNGQQSGDHTIKNGEKLTFKYRIYVHKGNAEEAKVADRYADYIDPPKVSWVK